MTIGLDLDLTSCQGSQEHPWTGHVTGQGASEKTQVRTGSRQGGSERLFPLDLAH